MQGTMLSSAEHVLRQKPKIHKIFPYKVTRASRLAPSQTPVSLKACFTMQSPASVVPPLQALGSGGVQKSMGREVPGETGLLIRLPVTSRPSIDRLHSEFSSPCNFATHQTEDSSSTPQRRVESQSVNPEDSTIHREALTQKTLEGTALQIGLAEIKKPRNYIS